jgi:hypothetical protein
MGWPPSIQVDISRDVVDWVSLSINLILGITAFVSLWLSRKVFKRSEYDSAMNTSPSIIVRPRTFWVGIKGKETDSAYIAYAPGCLIEKARFDHAEIVFCIEFECFNAGRGVAFNISQPKIVGMDMSNYRGDRRTPLYLTQDDEPFEIMSMLKGKHEDFHKNVNIEIPVMVFLKYTNDQNNIFCQSAWKAKIKPFDQVGDNLKVRDIRILQRNGKIEYSQKPFKAE